MIKKGFKIHDFNNCNCFFYPKDIKQFDINLINMVKYLSKGRGLTILLLAAIVTIAAASKTPVPTCNSPKIALQDLPISLQETQTFNMDDFFSGYNLNITIPSKVDGVDIRPKLFKTAGEAKPMPGLKNYHFSHRGNQWGDNLVAISI